MATVNPRGSETTYYLQYGPTSTYGAETPSSSAGGGAGEVKLAVSLSSLQADTLYHYRIVATSAAGSGLGPDRTFTTRKIPLTLSAGVRPSSTVFGSHFSVTGNLAGSENVNQELVLQIDPYPYKQGFADFSSPELSDASGNFSFPIAPIAGSSQLRVAALGPPTVYGPVLLERVAVRVTFHVRASKHRGFYRLYGSVAPALPGAHLAFQRLGRGGAPSTVSGAVLHGGTRSSHFSRTLRLTHGGLYRVAVQSTTPALLSNHSHWARVRRPRHQLTARTAAR
jgi:hypothetical protein